VTSSIVTRPSATSKLCHDRRGTQTIWQAICATAGRYPEPALFSMSWAEDRTFTGVELAKSTTGKSMTRSRNWQRRCKQKGFGPGFRFMLLMENRPDCLCRCCAQRIAPRWFGQSDLRTFRAQLIWRVIPEPSSSSTLRHRMRMTRGERKRLPYWARRSRGRNPFHNQGTAGRLRWRADGDAARWAREEMKRMLLYLRHTQPRLVILTQHLFLNPDDGTHAGGSAP